jgi:CheY-like chemotaxis protein
MQKTTPKLYYVDDDPDDRMFFEEVVAGLGIKAVFFETANALLEALKKTQELPAVIFTDLNMPIKSGYELVKEIRSDLAFEHIPIVVISTSGALPNVDKCFRLGASLYLRKANCFTALQQSIIDVLAMDWAIFERDRNNFICGQ